MSKIKITCDTCCEIHEVSRTNEIPKHVISMGCNWCPNCEDRAKSYYKEWYNYTDEDNENIGDNIPDNQLVMPFIFEEINENVEIDRMVMEGQFGSNNI